MAERDTTTAPVVKNPEVAAKFNVGVWDLPGVTEVLGKGRERLFETPQELAEGCVQYFKWAKNNPLWEDKVYVTKDGLVHEPTMKMRAMTIGGLSIFLGITQQAWGLYRRRETFASVCAHAEAVIRMQKFEGAAADLLNATFIARDLGLAERREITGAAGAPFTAVVGAMTPQQAAEAYAATVRSAALAAPVDDPSEDSSET